MMYKPIVLILAVLALAMLPAGAAFALEPGDPLVGDVFVTGFDGWTDTNTYRLPPEANWGVLLTDTKNLIETCNTILGPPGTPAPVSSTQPAGTADVWKLVNLDYSTPSNYTLSAKIGSWDDDGFGLIFGYEDEQNYFRVTCRAQSGSSYGYLSGVSVQKVVGGVTTTLANNAVIRPSIPTLLANTNAGVMFDLEVAVSGDNYEVKGNFTTSTPAATMTSYCSGTDPDGDLSAMSAGHYGVQSWAQYQGGGSSRYRGTEVESVTVTSDTFNKTHTFPGAIATNWRHLIMTDANGLMASGSDDYGNFRQAFTTGTISDDSNSYQWATTTAPNVDFVGQAVVVDEPGAVSWTDYEMTVRVSCIDDEGPGVLVRVQDDNTFYRINFATEPLAGNNGAYTYQRSPQGMSIQKCVDGGEGNPPVWTELFHDDQDDPAFLYTAGQEFDLKVTVVGNAITVSVIDDPDGTPNVIDYDPVYDDKGTPILSGSVALTNWGGGAAGLGPVFSAYGGIEGHALLTYVPEPSMLMLLGMLGVCSLAVRRRK